jgi:nitrogen-specific signal transduction histidine kinase
MASIEKLASGIAHELRNPLAGIQGAIQILAEGFPREDGRRQVADEIQKQIYKMERLVKDLLNYAKPVPTHYVPTNIHEVIDGVLSFFMTQRGKPGNFSVEKRYFSPMPQTMVDPSSMEQAFLNIVLNAYKAMPQGGTLTIVTQLLNGDRTEAVQVVFEIPASVPSRTFPILSLFLNGQMGRDCIVHHQEHHRTAWGTIEAQSQVNREPGSSSPSLSPTTA